MFPPSCTPRLLPCASAFPNNSLCFQTPPLQKRQVLGGKRGDGGERPDKPDAHRLHQRRRQVRSARNELIDDLQRETAEYVHRERGDGESVLRGQKHLQGVARRGAQKAHDQHQRRQGTRAAQRMVHRIWDIAVH